MWLTGHIALLAYYVTLHIFVDKKNENPEIDIYFFLLIIIHAAYAVIGNYQLVSGNCSVEKWLNLYVTPGICSFGFINSYFLVSYPMYATGGIIPFIGSLLLILDVVQKRHIFVIFLVFICSIWGNAYIFRQSINELPVLFHIASSSILLLYAYWLIRQARHQQTKNRQIKDLLRESRKARRTITEEKALSERLLLNILPMQIAEELKSNNQVFPRRFDCTSVLFTDFKGFTSIAESLSPEDLVTELDYCFSYFDAVTERNNLEKLKTIGDSFMCAGGLPNPNNTHAIDCILSALEIQSFMTQTQVLKAQRNLPFWELRLGIHSGPIVAGVIGEKKFAYDIWGDTVNTASRTESSGLPGKINVTKSTYELAKDFFQFEHRGAIAIKNKKPVEMYFVHGIKLELSRDKEGKVPNHSFREKYMSLQGKSLIVHS